VEGKRGEEHDAEPLREALRAERVRKRGRSDPACQPLRGRFGGVNTAAAVSPESTATSIPVRLRPPLKWAGGKRWQVQHVLRYWEAAGERRLVEPFAGGSAVTLGLLPDRALLNDVNPHLINFYTQLKRGLVINDLFDKSERAYYRSRERFNALLAAGHAKTAEAAGLFYYLNRTGYNGLCRFNQSGEFNVPFGRYKTLNYRYDFTDYKSVFAHWTFSNKSFRSLRLEPDDFVYADPPYDVEFTAYSTGGFDWEDQKAAATWLSKHPGPVVLSNQATDRIMDLYTKLKFTTRTVEAPRRISCTGDRSPALEVLAIRNM
jgi:DNA adenine methylase